MRSRVLLPVRVFASFRCVDRRQLRRPWSCAATAAGTGDPAVHSEDPQGDDAEEAAKAAAAERQQKERRVREGGGSNIRPPSATTTTRKSPFATSPKLENSEVPQPGGAAFQHKRPLHAPEPAFDLESVSCVGWDGEPLRGGFTADDGPRAEERREGGQAEDYKEYFEHHKPSPLSGLEFADTRRPIRRATDSDVADDEAGVGDVTFGWREEQEDTVDAALLRAELLFREASERGDPDTPHGKVLASYQPAWYWCETDAIPVQRKSEDLRIKI